MKHRKDLFLMYRSKIPIAPLPSLSEYPELQCRPTDKLSMQIFRNLSETKKIKEIYEKAIAKQSNSSIAEDPEVFPYIPAWDRDQLPPLNLDESSSQYLAKIPCGLLLAHIGFDGTEPC